MSSSGLPRPGSPGGGAASVTSHVLAVDCGVSFVPQEEQRLFFDTAAGCLHVVEGRMVSTVALTGDWAGGWGDGRGPRGGGGASGPGTPGGDRSGRAAAGAAARPDRPSSRQGASGREVQGGEVGADADAGADAGEPGRNVPPRADRGASVPDRGRGAASPAASPPQTPPAALLGDMAADPSPVTRGAGGLGLGTGVSSASASPASRFGPVGLGEDARGSIEEEPGLLERSLRGVAASGSSLLGDAFALGALRSALSSKRLSGGGEGGEPGDGGPGAPGSGGAAGGGAEGAGEARVREPEGPDARVTAPGDGGPPGAVRVPGAPPSRGSTAPSTPSARSTSSSSLSSGSASSETSEASSTYAFLASRGPPVSLVAASPATGMTAVQRSPRLVELVDHRTGNLFVEAPGAPERPGGTRRRANARLLGLFWPSPSVLSFVTDGGLETYDLHPSRQGLKLRQNQQTPEVRWYAHDPATAIVLLGTGPAGRRIQPFQWSGHEMLRLAVLDTGPPWEASGGGKGGADLPVGGVNDGGGGGPGSDAPPGGDGPDGGGPDGGGGGPDGARADGSPLAPHRSSLSDPDELLDGAGPPNPFSAAAAASAQATQVSALPPPPPRFAWVVSLYQRVFVAVADDGRLRLHRLFRDGSRLAHEVALPPGTRVDLSTVDDVLLVHLLGTHVVLLVDVELERALVGMGGGLGLGYGPPAASSSPGLPAAPTGPPSLGVGSADAQGPPLGSVPGLRDGIGLGLPGARASRARRAQAEAAARERARAAGSQPAGPARPVAVPSPETTEGAEPPPTASGETSSGVSLETRALAGSSTGVRDASEVDRLLAELESSTEVPEASIAEAEVGGAAERPAAEASGAGEPPPAEAGIADERPAAEAGGGDGPAPVETGGEARVGGEAQGGAVMEPPGAAALPPAAVPVAAPGPRPTLAPSAAPAPAAVPAPLRSSLLVAPLSAPLPIALRLSPRLGPPGARLEVAPGPGPHAATLAPPSWLAEPRLGVVARLGLDLAGIAGTAAGEGAERRVLAFLQLRSCKGAVGLGGGVGVGLPRAAGAGRDGGAREGLGVATGGDGPRGPLAAAQPHETPRPPPGRGSAGLGDPREVSLMVLSRLFASGATPARLRASFDAVNAARRRARGLGRHSVDGGGGLDVRAITEHILVAHADLLEQREGPAVGAGSGGGEAPRGEGASAPLLTWSLLGQYALELLGSCLSHGTDVPWGVGVTVVRGLAAQGRRHEVRGTLSALPGLRSPEAARLLEERYGMPSLALDVLRALGDQRACSELLFRHGRALEAARAARRYRLDSPSPSDVLARAASDGDVPLFVATYRVTSGEAPVAAAERAPARASDPRRPPRGAASQASPRGRPPTPTPPYGGKGRAALHRANGTPQEERPLPTSAPSFQQVFVHFLDPSTRGDGAGEETDPGFSPDALRAVLLQEIETE